MELSTLTYLFVGITFLLYAIVAIWARAGSTKEFYVAGGKVSPLSNGMATAADMVSVAGFISIPGIIAFNGFDASVYLIGPPIGFFLLGVLIAPYLRKFGKFTIPDFIGDRYYSNTARTIAIICAVFVSFTYLAGQMRGVGVVFSRFLEVSINAGVLIGAAIVFLYAVWGGMKGITYTQIVQYCVLGFAFLTPIIFLSIHLTNNPIPLFGMGDTVKGSDTYLLDTLDGLSKEFGFRAFTEQGKPTIDLICITASLMLGTAGMPHIIIRYFTVPKMSDARKSVAWTLLFVSILFVVTPPVAVFSRTLLLQTVPESKYSEIPQWFKTWEHSELMAWVDKDKDGVIHYVAGKAIEGKPNMIDGKDLNEWNTLKNNTQLDPKEQLLVSQMNLALKNWDGNTNEAGDPLGPFGQRLLMNTPTSGPNELSVDNDIIFLAAPEMAKLPNWVMALVAAGALAAALSTAAGLILVLSTSISHDLIKRQLFPNISDKRELLIARLCAGLAITVGIYFGINPPNFIIQTVTLAFSIAASTFFPAIALGIFTKKVNQQGIIAGMLTGLIFSLSYIIYFEFLGGKENGYWMNISSQGIGVVGLLINLAVTLGVGYFFPDPPQEVQDMVERIRYPNIKK